MSTPMGKTCSTGSSAPKVQRMPADGSGKRRRSASAPTTSGSQASIDRKRSAPGRAMSCTRAA